MKIVCFPHYTCGGLLCDILNNTFSSVGPHGGLVGLHHNLGKVKFIDTNSILDNFDSREFVDLIKQTKTTRWVSTHCWPGNVDTNEFEKVIVVSTNTYKSRLYRWIRSYHHYYSKEPSWSDITDQEKIDKERETAKNYLQPFEAVHKPNVVNIEFSEVVDQSVSFRKLVENCDYHKHIVRWREINNFLYNDNLLNSRAAKRFHEAEMEILQNQHYIYE